MENNKTVKLQEKIRLQEVKWGVDWIEIWKFHGLHNTARFQVLK